MADSLVETMARAHHKAHAAASDQGAPNKQHRYNILDDAFSALDDDHHSDLEFEEGVLHSELQDWRANGVCVGTKKMTSHDPLQFWKERREACPTLHLAAMLVLGGMASAARVHVERTWSVGGNVLDDLSTQLKPEMLGMLICIKRNWSLLLHEVQRKHTYMTLCKGQKVKVEQTEMDVNVDEIGDRYMSMYGKSKTAESAKRAATAKKQKAPDLDVDEEQDTSISVTQVVANATSPESAVPSQERATTHQSAAEARINEASDVIAAFNVDPTQYGQCSVCIEMEDCVFDGDGVVGHVHIDEEN